MSIVSLALYDGWMGGEASADKFGELEWGLSYGGWVGVCVCAHVPHHLQFAWETGHSVVNLPRVLRSQRDDKPANAYFSGRVSSTI